MPDYEQGYKDGESSGYADWIMALCDEFHPDEVIDGPQDFIRWLQAKCGWQPIETCKPHDGFAALVYVPGLNDWQRPSGLPRMLVAVFDAGYFGGGCWVSDVAQIEGYESTGDYIVHPPVYPTHWMPLPEPPK